MTVSGTTASIQGVAAAGGVVGRADKAVSATGTVDVSVGTITAVGGVAGGVIGTASDTVTLAAVTVGGTTASIQGSTAGGVVGKADKAVSTGAVNVSVGMIKAASGVAGGVIGTASDTVTLAAVTVGGTTASIQGSTAGGVVGAYDSTTALTFSDAPSVSGTVGTTGGAAGGIVGTTRASVTIPGTISVGTVRTTDGAAGGVIGTYTGTDTVSGLRVSGGTVTASTGTAGGVFGTVTGAASIRDIEIEDPSVSGGSCAGGLAGSVTGGAAVEGVLVWHRGGISAYSGYRDYMVTASGTDGAAGGLIGSVSGGTVTGCAASVLVEAAGTGGVAGGLIGSVSVSGTTTISGSYVGGHTDPSTDPDDPTRVRYPATENVTAGTGGTAGGFLGSVTGSGTVTIGTCYTTATADGGFIGGIGSTAAVTATGATYDATASKLSAANTSISGLKAGSAYMSDHDARPYDGKLHGVSDPFQAVDDDPDAYWFLRTHVGDWWPEAAAAYHTVTWKTPTGFARGVSATAYDTYTTLSDGSVQVHQDLVQDGDSVGLPTVDMTAFPLRLDYQIDYWTWFDLDEDPDTGAVTADTENQYLVRLDGMSYFARTWDEAWQSWSARTAAALGVSSPASVTKDLILYAHAKKDPTVVELRGYKKAWSDAEGDYIADTTKTPAYIEYPDQVTDPADGTKTVTFRTPTLGGYEIETSDGITWYYRDAAGEPMPINEDENGAYVKTHVNATETTPETWEIVVPEDVEYLYAYYAPVVERTVTVEFLSTGGSPIHTPAVYAFAKAGETLTIDLPADGRMPDYTPQSYTDADGASADLTADTKQIAIRSGDGPTVWKVYYQNTAYHDVKIVHEIQSVADSVTADSILTQIPNYYADASTKVTIGTPAPGTTDLTVTETTERGTGEALSSTLDGLTAKHMETFRLTIANYTSTMPRLSAETAEDGVTVTGYVVTITYVRQPVTLYYDLNGGTYDHDGISEIGISNSRGKPGDASDSYTKTHNDANESVIVRDGYAPVSWRLVKKSEYDAASKTQLENWRAYNEGETGLTAYGTNVTLPAEDSVAILIWEPKDKTGHVTVRIYLQKRTDSKTATDSQKQYDYLTKMDLGQISVNDYYAKQSTDFGKKVLDQGFETSKGHTANGETYYVGDSGTDSSKGYKQRDTVGTGKTTSVFFDLNWNNSNVYKRVGPGENIIELYYDRAKMQIDFTGIRIVYATERLMTASDLHIKEHHSTVDARWGKYVETTDYTTYAMNDPRGASNSSSTSKSGTKHTDGQPVGTRSYSYGTYSPTGNYWVTDSTIYYEYKRNSSLRYWTRARTYRWEDCGSETPTGTIATIAVSAYPSGWNSGTFSGFTGTGEKCTAADGTVYYHFSKTTEWDAYDKTYGGPLDDSNVVNWWIPNGSGYSRATSDGTNVKFGALVDGTLTELYLYDGTTATMPTMAAYEWREDGFYRKFQGYYNVGSTETSTFTGLYQADLDFPWPTDRNIKNTFKNTEGTTTEVTTPILTAYYYPQNMHKFTISGGVFKIKFEDKGQNVYSYQLRYYLELDGDDKQPPEGKTIRTASTAAESANITTDASKAAFLERFPDVSSPNATTRVNGTFSWINRYIGYDSKFYRTSETGSFTYKAPNSDTPSSNSYWIYNLRHEYTISYLNAYQARTEAEIKAGQEQEDLKDKGCLFKEWIRKLPGEDEIEYSDTSYTFDGWSEDGKTAITDEYGYFLNGDFGGSYDDGGTTRYYYSMPAANKTFIALWWSPIRVDLVYKDESGRKVEGFRTVDKYASMTGADHTAADDGIKGLNWYFDAACTIPFDFTKDPVINNDPDPDVRVMTLYGTTASGEEISIPVYYRFGDDYLSPDGTLSHSAVRYDTVQGIVGGSYIAEADPILTLTADGVEHIYQLADDQESVLSGEVSDKTKDGLATDGVTFRYVEYADTEWSYVVVTDLRIGSGDETVLLRTGSETVSGQTERRVVVPAEDRQGLKLRSDSYQVVDRPAGDGTAVVEVVYEPDLHNIRFSGGTASAADLPRAYAWFSSEGVLVPLCGYFHLIPGIDWTDADGAVWVLGADYTYTPASGGGASTISEIYGVEDDGTTQKVTTIASADIPSGAYSVTADVWAAKRSGDSVSGKVTIKSMTADLTVE